MLIGAHVSTAGGLDKAVERGIETRSDAIQVFNQSPRMWRPTRYTDEDFARAREALDGSPVESIAIHAVYLINCATADAELRKKSLASLTHALEIGDGIGAAGVVLHAGAAKGDPIDVALKRAVKVISEALKRTERCPLLLENTAGSKGLLGRDMRELEELIERAGGDERLGVCIDCCHLLASGYEIRDEAGLGAVVDELDELVGLERLRCLHVNDSAIPAGGNRDKHANLGEGELGRKGLSVFLSEPRFEGLPALIEVPGPDGRGPDRRQVQIAKRLRRTGLKRRCRSA
jgi:deoxyribonuclease IV